MSLQRDSDVAGEDPVDESVPPFCYSFLPRPLADVGIARVRRHPELLLSRTSFWKCPSAAARLSAELPGSCSQYACRLMRSQAPQCLQAHQLASTLQARTWQRGKPGKQPSNNTGSSPENLLGWPVRSTSFSGLCQLHSVCALDGSSTSWRQRAA